MSLRVFIDVLENFEKLVNDLRRVVQVKTRLLVSKEAHLFISQLKINN